MISATEGKQLLHVIRDITQPEESRKVQRSVKKGANEHGKDIYD